MARLPVGVWILGQERSRRHFILELSTQPSLLEALTLDVSCNHSFFMCLQCHQPKGAQLRYIAPRVKFVEIGLAQG